MSDHNTIPYSVGVHDGVFHADDVSAVALLYIYKLIHLDRIIRSRDANVLRCCEYVCDVGGVWDSTLKRFDHHQNDYTGDKSSAGLILAYLIETGFIDEELGRYLHDNYINSIDLTDTGRTVYSQDIVHISEIVSACVPVRGVKNQGKKEFEKAFIIAVEIVAGHIMRLRNRFCDIKEHIIPVVKQKMENDRDILFFDSAIDWSEAFFMLGGEKHPALFVIMPDHDKEDIPHSNWMLRCIPNVNRGIVSRFPLPAEWGGLFGEELSKISGIPGGVFCHKNLFLSIWNSKESACIACSRLKN